MPAIRNLLPKCRGEPARWQIAAAKDSSCFYTVILSAVHWLETKRRQLIVQLPCMPLLYELDDYHRSCVAFTYARFNDAGVTALAVCIFRSQRIE